MARAVLALLLTTAGLLGAAEPQTCSPPVDTPAATKTEIQNLHQALKSGPFYGELVRRFGKPLSCTMDLDAGNISISYAFRDSVQLVTRVSRSIESSEQRVDLPRMDTKRAIGLLREAEKAAYRPRGCGIAWNRPEQDRSEAKPGSREIVYRGAACNCQARLIYSHDSVVALVLKSAC